MKSVRYMKLVGIASAVLLMIVAFGSIAQTAVQDVDLQTGALVIAVAPDSPADDAGIQRGDIIHSVDGMVVESNAAFAELVRTAEPGDSLELEVAHGDDFSTVTVELADLDGRPFLGVWLARDIDVSDGADGAENVEEGADAGAITDSEDAAETDDTGDAEDADEADTTAADETVESDEMDEAEGADMDDGDDAIEAGETAEAEESQELDEQGMTALTEIAGGAMIVAVAPDSPAEGAGLREGEVILGIDGVRFTDMNDLAVMVEEYEPGETITLELLVWTGEIEDVDVILGEHPTNEGSPYIGIRYVPTPYRMFIGHGRDGSVLVPWGAGWPRGLGPRARDWNPYAFPDSDDNSTD